MSNGYLAAASADLDAARDLADGFGLDATSASAWSDSNTAAAALGGAANLGLMLSHAATRDAAYVALLQKLSTRPQGAQLILVEADARAAFGYLPAAWPVMSYEEALRRSTELKRRRDAEHAPPAPQSNEPTHAAPLPPQAPEPAPQAQPEPPPVASHEEAAADQGEGYGAAAPIDADTPAGPGPNLDDVVREGNVTRSGIALGGELDDTETPALPIPTILDEAPPAPDFQPPPMPASEAPVAAQAPAASEPAKGDDAQSDGVSSVLGGVVGGAPRPRRQTAEAAPADATAFAPKKLRRGTPELVRISIHQPQDLKAVIKAARKADPTTAPSPQGMPLGKIELGAHVGVSLEVRGAECDGALQRREWRGDPLDFSYALEADVGVKQVVIMARVFVDDAQIGTLAFTRPVSGPSKKPASDGDPARLKRFKRVFLSYSSQDRETVAQIATAYQMAGVEHFFDRTSLKPGEEWSPRLLREIDRSDLFHLCWSKAASSSEWVEKEAEHALTRRRRSNGKTPAITVQMLDGPPWAPHPKHLDAINFDDFVRAAIVGYARGEG